jgi:ATP-binding cassette subfamily B protein
MSRREDGLWKLWTRAVVYLRPHWRVALLAVAALLVQVAFETVFPLGYKWLIDWAIVPRDPHRFAMVMAGLGAAFVVSSVVTVAREYLLADLGVRTVNGIRLEMARRLHMVSLDFFTRMPAGDLTSRFTGDLSAIEQVVGRSLPGVIGGALSLAVSVVLCFVLEWKLALITMAALPLILVGPRLLASRANTASHRRAEAEAAIAVAADELVVGQTLIRAFGLVGATGQRFHTRLIQLADSGVRAMFLSRMVAWSATIGLTLVRLVIIGAGALLVIRGDMSIGTLIGFMALLINVDHAVGLLSQGIPDCIQAIGGVERVDALLREPAGVMDAADAHGAPRVHDIAFRDVTFGYPGRPPCLRHVSFAIAAGQHVAFVGRSGAGKSTILGLLARLYDPREGAMTVNGEDVRRLTQDSLRARMAVVLQETVLFSGSVLDNIRLARPDATDVEIEAAATAAQLHHVVRSWPDGYATAVGEGGRGLSGGQRQRIALARALLRDPDILLLDEATSALDPEKETAFNHALAELVHERMVISVTHRLPTVAHADQIFVIEAGEIVERGTHQELLDLEGTYHQLWHQQSGFVVSPDGRRAEITPARLSEITLFAELSETLRAEICDQFVSEWCAAGTTIVEQNEPGDKFYIVVRGKVSVSRTSPDGTVQPLRVLEDGDFFGEIALLQDVRRTSTVRALEPTLLLVLTRPHFLRLLEAAPEVRRTLEATAATRRKEYDAFIGDIPLV